MSSFADYVRHGWALVPLTADSAKPARSGWNRRDGVITEVAELPDGLASAALAHAYSRTCALDIDDMAAFEERLAQWGLPWDALAGPDAVFLSSGRPNRAKLLYRLDLPLPSVLLCRTEDGDAVAELHCATRDGLTLKDTLPPSVHRTTGEPYYWEYGDELVGDWRALPELPDALYQRWVAILEAHHDDGSLGAPVEPVPIAELAELLEGRHPDMSYPDWIRVGMALHHARNGDESAFTLWNNWSSLGDKYPGEKALRSHWRSFRYVANPVTAGSLRKEAVVSPKLFATLGAKGLPETAAEEEAEEEEEEEEEEAVSLLPASANDAPFPLTPIADIVRRPPTPWLVDKLLPQADLAMLYGGAGSGKSFLALDLAFSVAQGFTFFNRACQQGPVVWVAAEAAGAMALRARAYSRATDQSLDGLPLWVIEQTPALQQRDDALALARSLVKARPRLIVIDTLAAASAGADENSGQDMNTVLTTCRGLHQATGALVLLVHHAGKDVSRGARGWSGLRAAVQTEWQVDSSDILRRRLHVTKQRDAPDGLELAFRLQPVDLDLDGASSCVIVPLDEAYVAPEQRTVVAHTGRKRVLSAIRNLVTIAGDATVGIPAQDVYDEAAKLMPPPAAGKRDGRYAAIRQALLGLAESGHIHFADDQVRLGSDGV